LAFRQKAIEVDRCIVGRILEAEGDLRVAEPDSGVAVQTAAAFAEGLLDLMTQLAARAVEIAGDARFVLTEFAADLGKGLLRSVIHTKALFVVWVEQAERDLQGATEESDKLVSMRIF
jgi:hypothetical protein